MITKVYVAGASAQLERAKAAIVELERHSIVVTSSWPKVIGAVGAPNPRDATLAQYTEWSLRDLGEVDEADYLLLLLPPRGIETVGAYVELGYSFAKGKPIVTAGEHRPIFTPALSMIHFPEDAGALEWLVGQHTVMVAREVHQAMQERETHVLRSAFEQSDLDNGS